MHLPFRSCFFSSWTTHHPHTSPKTILLPTIHSLVAREKVKSGSKFFGKRVSYILVFHHQHEQRKQHLANCIKIQFLTSKRNERQPLSQVLSTFSAVEQDRFNAFRRNTFARDVVSSFVTSSLVNASRHVQTHRKIELGMTSSQSASPTVDAQHLKYLSDCVAPGTSVQIIFTVRTVAKIYAQRLLQSARNLATERNHGHDVALLPEHILEAYQQRVRNGVDPGFFMQADVGIARGAIQMSSLDSLELKKNVDITVEAQDECDKLSKKE